MRDELDKVNKGETDDEEEELYLENHRVREIEQA